MSTTQPGAAVSRPPPPWLFAISSIPFGVVGAFGGTVLPYMARGAGKDPDAIGWYSALVMIPPIVQFLYAPIVDVGPKRKHWLIIVSVLGAAALMGAFTVDLRHHFSEFLAFVVTAQLISGLVGSCNGGLLAVSMPDELRGRAAAWLNMGNLSGGALSASLAIWMTGRVPPLVVGFTLAAMMVLSSLVILYVVEPPRDNIQRVRKVFATTLRDVKQVLWSKKGITGILLCLSPVGTSALANEFTAFAKQDYHVSQFWVGFVSGGSNALLTALGALVGGYLCDRYNRRAMYLLSGTLTAICGIAMALSARTEMTYAIGVSVYYLVMGFCYAAFTATVLETVDQGGQAASTQYSLFTSAGNAAIAYVGFTDTRFYAHYHVQGVVGSDAGLNLLGVIVLAFVFWRLGAFGKSRRKRQAEQLAEARVVKD